MRKLEFEKRCSVLCMDWEAERPGPYLHTVTSIKKLNNLQNVVLSALVVLGESHKGRT